MSFRSLFSVLVLSLILLTCQSALSEVEPLSIEDLQKMNNGQAVISQDENSAVTFIGGRFFNRPVLNDDDAFDALMGVLPLLGGDDDSTFISRQTVSTDDGSVYYLFIQSDEDGASIIDNSTVKIGVKGDGTTFLLTSSLTPSSKKLYDTVITEKEAERIVSRENAFTGCRILPDATEEHLIYNEFENYDSQFLSVYVVYTNNPDNRTDYPYLAHYVEKDGTYLYSLEVSMPGSPTVDKVQDNSEFFRSMTPVPFTQKVTWNDHTREELTATVMKDTDGTLYLGDPERHVLVADYYEYTYNDTYAPVYSENGVFPEKAFAVYSTFMKVYDYYADMEWVGPDGEETDVLLLYDLCDEEHEPVDNAYYSGFSDGWQVFAFNSIEDDGRCMDVIAHEFTHCVIEASMFYNIYANDYGAINESLCDIMGNLIEMAQNATEDTKWLIGENGTLLRSMSDPRLYGQPEAVWDLYYVPNAQNPGSDNDNGGVHVNSSLLNLIAYKLCARTGMTFEEATDFWLDVVCAITCRTNFRELSDLLPYMLRYSGYPQYCDELLRIIDETGLAGRTQPQSIPSDASFVTMDVPHNIALHDSDVIFSFSDADDPDLPEILTTWLPANTWQLKAVIPQGNYLILLSYQDGESVLVYADGRWIPFDDISYDLDLFKAIDSTKISLSPDGLDRLAPKKDRIL